MYSLPIRRIAWPLSAPDFIAEITVQEGSGSPVFLSVNANDAFLVSHCILLFLFDGIRMLYALQLKDQRFPICLL